MPDGFPGFGQPRPVRFRPCAGGFCGSLREQGGRGRDRAPAFTFAVPRRTSGKSGSGNSAFCRADGRRTCGARFLPDMRRTENPRGFEIRSEPLSLPPKRVGKIHENIQDTFDERFARGGRSDSRRAGRPHGDRVSRRDGRGQDDADPGGLRPALRSLSSTSIAATARLRSIISTFTGSTGSRRRSTSATRSIFSAETFAWSSGPRRSRACSRTMR